jgi:hypothetical protein
VGVTLGSGLGVRVALGLGEGLGTDVSVTAPGVTGAVALTRKFWLAGKVTAKLAGITIGLLHALRKKMANVNSAANFFMSASFCGRILTLFYMNCRFKLQTSAAGSFSIAGI